MRYSKRRPKPKPELRKPPVATQIVGVTTTDDRLPLAVERVVPWTPIVKGPVQDAAFARILEIAHIFEDLAWPRTGWSRCLARGRAGVAIFLNYLPDGIRSPETDRRCLQLLIGAMRNTWSSFQGWSLFEGETGIGWALAHCARSWRSSEIESVLEDIDRRAVEYLKQLQGPVPFDLISGVVGIGVYALERLPRPAARYSLEAVVDYLDAAAISDGNGLSWPTRPEFLPEQLQRRYPKGFVDLGMAHGVPGVLALLSLAYAAGVRRRRAARLVEQGLKWLLHAAEPAVSGGLRFPFRIVPDGSRAGSRNAWCYGDAGVASAIALAGRSFQRPEWGALAVDIGRNAARCKGRVAGVVDPGLCHGASGLAHTFNRLFQSTGDADCLGAARHWLSVAAQMRNDEGLAGYAAWGASGRARWDAERGLLEGIAGIGLALVAAITAENPAWDRCLLLA